MEKPKQCVPLCCMASMKASIEVCWLWARCVFICFPMFRPKNNKSCSLMASEGLELLQICPPCVGRLCKWTHTTKSLCNNTFLNFLTLNRKQLIPSDYDIIICNIWFKYCTTDTSLRYFTHWSIKHELLLRWIYLVMCFWRFEYIIFALDIKPANVFVQWSMIRCYAFYHRFTSSERNVTVFLKIVSGMLHKTSFRQVNDSTALFLNKDTHGEMCDQAEWLTWGVRLLICHHLLHAHHWAEWQPILIHLPSQWIASTSLFSMIVNKTVINKLIEQPSSKQP